MDRSSPARWVCGNRELDRTPRPTDCCWGQRRILRGAKVALPLDSLSGTVGGQRPIRSVGHNAPCGRGPQPGASPYRSHRQLRETVPSAPGPVWSSARPHGSRQVRVPRVGACDAVQQQVEVEREQPALPHEPAQRPRPSAPSLLDRDKADEARLHAERAIDLANTYGYGMAGAIARPTVEAAGSNPGR
jgi:hypothetical protein